MGKEVGFGGLQIPSLLFADDVVLLASSKSDLQLSLGQIAAESEAAWMTISTSKTEVIVPSWKSMDSPGWVERITSLSGGVQVSQVLDHKWREKGAGGLTDRL